MREEWDSAQAVKDIERQISGEVFGPPEEPTKSRSACPMGGAQRRILKILMAPMSDTILGELHRRGDAIKALIAYCFIEEPRISKMTQAPPLVLPIKPISETTEVPWEEQLKQFRREVFVSTMGRDKVRRYFLCIARAIYCEPDDPNLADLCRDFSTGPSLGRYFRNYHMTKVAKGEFPVECPICEMRLLDADHILSHALLVHGVRTERAYRVA